MNAIKALYYHKRYNEAKKYYDLWMSIAHDNFENIEIWRSSMLHALYWAKRMLKYIG
jgi:hypothetical protein